MRTMRPAGFWFLSLLAAATAPAMHANASEGAEVCATPQEYLQPDEPLDQVATAIAAGGPLDILAIGSASTTGEGGGNATPYPRRMAEALKTALPGVEIRLKVLGGRGMTAEAMLPLLTEALGQQHFQLVLWQTGTVEAARGLRPDSLQEVLADGAARIRDGGGDLILIDPQFSRFLRANTNLDVYETVLQQVATMPGVVLFHRFDLMHAWVSEGVADLERASKSDRKKVLDQINACLGDALARFILDGAGIKPQ